MMLMVRKREVGYNIESEEEDGDFGPLPNADEVDYTKCHFAPLARSSEQVTQKRVGRVIFRDVLKFNGARLADITGV